MTTEVLERSWKLEKWHIGQVMVRRDVRGQFMVGHRHAPPWLLKNLEKGCSLAWKGTEKQLEAARKNLEKSHEKLRREGMTEKQLEVIHAPRTKKQMAAIRKNLAKGKKLGGKALWDKIRRGELSPPAKGKHWHLENGKRIYV